MMQGQEKMLSKTGKSLFQEYKSKQKNSNINYQTPILCMGIGNTGKRLDQSALCLAA